MLPGLNLPLVPIGSAAAVPTVENISLDTIKSRFIADSPSMYLSTQYQYAYDGSTTNISDGGSDMFDTAATLNLTPSAGPSFSTIPFDTHDKTNSVQYGRTATGYWPNLLYALLPANFSTTIGETGNYGADSSGSIVTNNSGTPIVYSGFTYTWTSVHVYAATDPSIGWLCFSIATGNVSLPAITSSHSGSTDTPNPTWTIPTFTGKRIVGLMLLSKASGTQISTSEFDTAVKTFIDRVIYGRKTLAQFTTHVNSLSSTIRGGTTAFGAGASGKYLCNYPVKTTGTLWGTPWGSVFTYDSNSAKVIWHSLPSEAVFDAQIANNGNMIADITSIGNYASYIALTRNGLTSSSYGAYDGLRLNSLIYWDYATGSAKIVYPNTQTGPVDYIF